MKNLYRELNLKDEEKKLEYIRLENILNVEIEGKGR